MTFRFQSSACLGAETRAAGGQKGTGSMPAAGDGKTHAWLLSGGTARRELPRPGRQQRPAGSPVFWNTPTPVFIQPSLRRDRDRMQVQLRIGLRSPLPSLAESRDLRDHLLLLPGTGENVRHLIVIASQLSQTWQQHANTAFLMSRTLTDGALAACPTPCLA